MGKWIVSQAAEVVIEGVVKRFGRRAVLDGLDLRVASGETVALVGPSGGGKSTLLRVINGLTPFDEGRIRVGPHILEAHDGRAQRAAARQVRQRFGMVFQDFQLFPHFTALGNIVEAPRHVLGLSAEESRQRGMALLARVGLADRAEAYPNELSGGQKQRVAIARALAMQPAGLLCDEITSALDPELKGEVLAVLEDLRGDGMTLIVVTHEMGFARHAADRIVVLDEGRVIEDGPPGQVLDSPQKERTRRFLSRLLV
ncbi:MAG: amino acid ABC transporter ATP-binding protein [Rhodopirellula sp.]|nr:amino acid ABC transporter ATP-binding protein [Rhodopirellula sp.]